jgi:DNA repair protein RadC
MTEYKTFLKRISLVAEKTEIPRHRITSSQISNDYIRQFFSDDIAIFESVFILLLNRSNVAIGYAKISQGGVSGTVVDPKLVAKYAIDALASGVIICHNHPSGNLEPSRSDDDITKKIQNGLNLFDIHLIDHLIIVQDARSSYYSYKDEFKL